MKFRNLYPEEIECRVQAVYGKAKRPGVALLLYKDARVDQRLLDETVGSMNWQRHHSRDNANCIVSIWDDDKQMWIEKEDVGTESYTEAAKGLASDSFKRACFNWGIGRGLYTAPFIYVMKCEIYEDKDSGKWKCDDRFRVSEISYLENGDIASLKIVNAKSGEVVYSWEDHVERTPRTLTSDDDAIGDVGGKQVLDALVSLGESPDVWCKRYKVATLSALTGKQQKEIGEKLRELKAQKNEKA